MQKGGRLAPLGPRAFDLLVDLLQHEGRVVDKADLIARVWKGAAVTDNSLTRAIREIRQAIGDDAAAPRYIETVARRGYCVIAGVRVRTAPSKLMLVVLPFADLSRDPADCFCDRWDSQSRSTCRHSVESDMISGIIITRFVDARAVEEWEEMDLLGLLRQLGATP